MNQQPFDQIVTEHGATVLRVCRAVVGEHDADDAWSETFLAALRAWSTLPADACVEAWLVTIAHRKAIDVIRARGRRAVPRGAAADWPDDPAPGGRRARDPGEAVARDLDLAVAVAELPTKQRTCVAYHHLGGLSFAEVAELVGGTAAAARRAASDGIARLRQTYDVEALSYD